MFFWFFPESNFFIVGQQNVFSEIRAFSYFDIQVFFIFISFFKIVLMIFLVFLIIFQKSFEITNIGNYFQVLTQRNSTYLKTNFQNLKTGETWRGRFIPTWLVFDINKLHYGKKKIRITKTVKNWFAWEKTLQKLAHI